MGQGPDACVVDLVPRTKLCAWSEFMLWKTRKITNISLPILASTGPVIADGDNLPLPDLLGSIDQGWYTRARESRGGSRREDHQDGETPR